MSTTKKSTNAPTKSKRVRTGGTGAAGRKAKRSREDATLQSNSIEQAVGVSAPVCGYDSLTEAEKAELANPTPTTLTRDDIREKMGLATDEPLTVVEGEEVIPDVTEGDEKIAKLMADVKLAIEESYTEFAKNWVKGTETKVDIESFRERLQGIVAPHHATIGKMKKFPFGFTFHIADQQYVLLYTPKSYKVERTK